VVVGTNPHLHEQLKQINKNFETKVKELDEVIKLLTFLDKHPEKAAPEIRTKAEGTRVALLEATRQLTQDNTTWNSNLN